MNIGNESSAYLMGILQTDGHLQRKRMSLEISEKDIGILKKLQSYFGGRISTRMRNTNFKENYCSACWTIGSVSFVKELVEAGVPIGKKSDIISPCHVPSNLERHYIRGLIDGDGSLGITSRGIPFVSFVTSSTPIRDYYCSWLGCLGIKSAPNRNKRDNVFNICVTKENAQKVAGILYDNAEIAIDRKRISATKVQEWVRPENQKRRVFQTHRWTDDMDKVVLENEMEVAAKILGRTIPSVMTRRWRISPATQ